MGPRDEPGPAVLEPVEPVDHVPFEELLRGVQEDLLAGDRRVHPDQVDRVLQLVAEPERPAGLVEPPTGPDPLGEGLVLEPVEVAVELGAGGLDADGVHQGRPPARGSLRGSTGRRSTSWNLRMTASARARSSAWPRTTTTVGSPPGGISRVVRNAAIGRSSREPPLGRARPDSDEVAGRATSRAGAEELGRGSSRSRSGSDRDRREGRPVAEACSAGSRRAAVPCERCIAGSGRMRGSDRSPAARRTRAGRRGRSGSRGRPAAASGRSTRFRTVSR